MKTILLITFCLITTITSAQECPSWNQQIRNSGTDKLYTIGTGSSRESAIEQAIESILRRYKCSGAVVSKTEVEKIDKTTKKQRYKASIINCDQTDIFEFNVVDECKDAGQYKVLTEVFAPKLKKAALFSIVPGAGQYYKKEPLIGTSLLIGTLGSLGMMAHSFSESNFYSSQIALTRITQERIAFQSQSDKWNKRALSFGVASGILYGASIAHASFAKKKNRLYAINEHNPYSIKPYYAVNSAGLSFTYNLK